MSGKLQPKTDSEDLTNLTVNLSAKTNLQLGLKAKMSIIQLKTREERKKKEKHRINSLIIETAYKIRIKAHH